MSQYMYRARRHPQILQYDICTSIDAPVYDFGFVRIHARPTMYWRNRLHTEKKLINKP